MKNTNKKRKKSFKSNLMLFLKIEMDKEVWEEEKLSSLQPKVLY